VGIGLSMETLSRRGYLKKVMALAAMMIGILACSLGPLSVPGNFATQVSSIATKAPGAVPTDQTGLVDIPLLTGYGVRGPFYEIYFTDPFNPASAKDEGGPDVPLVAAINAARISVDVATYSLSLYSIQDALVHANNGVCWCAW
jgi:hypothetical protein